MPLEALSDFAYLGIRLALPDLLLIFLLVVIAVVGIKVIDRVTRQLRKKGGDQLKVKVVGSFTQIVFVAVIIIIMLSRVGVTDDFLKLIGLVVGGIVAFSSTSLILNLVSGFVIHLTKPFSLGEIIQVGDVLGKVEDIKSVHTQIYTFQKTTVLIPNANFLKDEIINYSKTGFRVKVKVTLGYDIDRTQAEEALIKSAMLIHLDDVFVAITDFKNHSIEYELNGTSHEPDALPFIEARLRKTILDEFAMRGLEIMSPTIISHRTTGKVIPKMGVKEKVKFRKKEKEEAMGVRKQVNDTFEERRKKRKTPKKGKRKR